MPNIILNSPIKYFKKTIDASLFKNSNTIPIEFLMGDNFLPIQITMNLNIDDPNGFEIYPIGTLFYIEPYDTNLESWSFINIQNNFNAYQTFIFIQRNSTAITPQGFNALTPWIFRTDQPPLNPNDISGSVTFQIVGYYYNQF